MHFAPCGWTRSIRPVAVRLLCGYFVFPPRRDMLDTTFHYFAHVVIAFHAFQRPERDVC